MKLRRGSIRDAPASVKRRSKSRYDGFDDLRSCWEQSRDHKAYFIKYLDCPAKALYHKYQHGCKAFDDMITRWATEPHKVSFLNYYTIEGRLPRDSEYLQGAIKKSSVLAKYAKCSLIKKREEEIDGAVPEPYSEWPRSFDVYDLLFSAAEREDMLGAIENCIERRLLFRNACIKSCCTKIKTDTHDDFLQKLQVCRAILIAYGE